jgi:glyoxylase-like metal-dependent hydrolase (beta-lactamase superfamily II)
MPVYPITPGIFAIPLGGVNALLLAMDDVLTLIDTGSSTSAETVLHAIRAVGYAPTALRHILVTHCHADHAGSLAALKAATGAHAWMHPLDAAMVRTGAAWRTTTQPTPGLLNHVIYRQRVAPTPRIIPPAVIEHEVVDGDILPIAGGIQAIHAPGHSAGQLAWLWPQQGGVLFAADAAVNVVALRLAPSYESLEDGLHTLARLSRLTFETACFGHGSAIVHGADVRFRRKWLSTHPVQRHADRSPARH